MRARQIDQASRDKGLCGEMSGGFPCAEPLNHTTDHRHPRPWSRVLTPNDLAALKLLAQTKTGWALKKGHKTFVTTRTLARLVRLGCAEKDTFQVGSRWTSSHKADGRVVVTGTFAHAWHARITARGRKALAQVKKESQGACKRVRSRGEAEHAAGDSSRPRIEARVKSVTVVKGLRPSND